MTEIWANKYFCDRSLLQLGSSVAAAFGQNGSGLGRCCFLPQVASAAGRRRRSAATGSGPSDGRHPSAGSRGEIVLVTLASTSRRRWIAAERRFQPRRRRGVRGEDAPTLRARGRRGGGAAKIAMASGVGARIFARAEGRHAKLLFLPSLFVKLLESFFLIFLKVDGCQVEIANSWRCSKGLLGG